MNRKRTDYLRKLNRNTDNLLISGQIWLMFIVLLFFLNIIDIKSTLIFLLFSLLIIIILFYNQKIKMIKYNLSNNKNYERYNESDNEDIVENFEFNVVETEKINEKENNHCEPFSARINYHCLSKDRTSPYDNSTLVHLTEDIKKNEKIYNYDKIKQQKLGNPNFLTKTSNQSLVGPANPKTMVPPIIAPRIADLEYWRMNDKLRPEIVNVVKDRYENESGYNVSYSPEEYTYKEPVEYSCSRKKKKNRKTNQPNMTFSKDVDTNKYSIIENFPYEVEPEDDKYPELEDKERLLFNKPFNNNTLFKGKYNPNVFTQSISPSTYHINDRNEPINSMMGVSYPQQFEESNYEEIEPYEDVNMSNVYDPRFNGYGTSYRSYIDDVAEQPRFYYDDVNAIKMPNYISRSNIDVTPFGDKYGALQKHNPYTPSIHKLADKHYMDSMNTFRDEMQERLMRKRNSEMWQTRMYPISKNNQRMLK